jgi:ABC-type transporter lipoprotein component MlaA
VTVRAVPLLLALLLCACSTIETRHRDWSHYTGPGAAEFHVEEPPAPPALADPLEPLNRVMFDVNGALLDDVVEPFATGWSAVTSRGVRDHIVNFGSNLTWPVRLVSNLLEGELPRAGIETGRFVINTTVGLLGFFDPASDLGLPAPPPQDVGQAFGAWGWQPHVYVHLPVLGPRSDRDATGALFDIALDPATYYFPLRPFLLLNELTDRVEQMLRLQYASEDAYEIVRTAATLYRSREAVAFASMTPPTAAVRSLEAAFFDARDPDFFGRRETRHARVPATGRKLPYELWLRDGAAPLVFVLPGLGSHRLSGQAVGLAEMAFDAGCSVVTVSSSMHPEFMECAATAPLPGYLPWDVADVGGALAAVQADLDAEYPGRFTRRGLAGLSLGALESLALASGPGGEAWDAVVAIDPPVTVEHASRQLDTLYRAPLQWPADTREARIRKTLLKVVGLAEGSDDPLSASPFEEPEAEYLIGLSFRWTLRSAIFDSQLREPAGVLLTELSSRDRGPAYREIDAYGYMKYAYAFLLPAVHAREPDVSDGPTLFARCDLRGREATLAGDTRLHVLDNRDDFLLEPGDIDWLQQTFGSRLELFDVGGHLGNLGHPGVRLAITEALRKALSLTP